MWLSFSIRQGLKKGQLYLEQLPCQGRTFSYLFEFIYYSETLWKGKLGSALYTKGNARYYFVDLPGRDDMVFSVF